MASQPIIELVEVGPRDGLQNEPKPITVDKKIKLIDALSKCGFQRIEAGSFVSPRWVPQMADSLEVFKRIHRNRNIKYVALVPNQKGLEIALEAKVDEIAVFVSASEGFSKANINQSIAASLHEVTFTIQQAIKESIPVRGYVSCVVKCPYDGYTAPDRVAALTEQLIDLGCYQVSLGDTIGAGTPTIVARLLDCVLRRVSNEQLAGHFHDTGGLAKSNIMESIKFGIVVFDTAIGGLGGCPFAPGSVGNASTEKIHFALSKARIETGLDFDKLIEASKIVRTMAK